MKNFLKIFAVFVFFFVISLIVYKRSFLNKDGGDIKPSPTINQVSEGYRYPTSEQIDSSTKESDKYDVVTETYETKDSFSQVVTFYKELLVQKLGHGEIVVDREDSFIAKVNAEDEILIAVTKNLENTVIIITKKNERL